MEMCSKCGIVFDDSDCPLCLAKDEISGLENTISELERNIKQEEK